MSTAGNARVDPLQKSKQKNPTHMRKQSITQSQLEFYRHILVQVRFWGEGVKLEGWSQRSGDGLHSARKVLLQLGFVLATQLNMSYWIRWNCESSKIEILP